MTNTTLTFAERAVLANQYQILEKLDPEHAADYAQSREIVENGYEALYETINPAIKTASIPIEAGKEVFGILDMFTAIESSLGRIGKNADELSVAFEGFDTESHHHFKLAYFLRRKQGNGLNFLDTPIARLERRYPVIERCWRPGTLWASRTR